MASELTQTFNFTTTSPLYNTHNHTSSNFSLRFSTTMTITGCLPHTQSNSSPTNQWLSGKCCTESKPMKKLTFNTKNKNPTPPTPPTHPANRSILILESNGYTISSLLRSSYKSRGGYSILYKNYRSISRKIQGLKVIGSSLKWSTWKNPRTVPGSKGIGIK